MGYAVLKKKVLEGIYLNEETKVVSGYRYSESGVFEEEILQGAHIA